MIGSENIHQAQARVLFSCNHCTHTYKMQVLCLSQTEIMTLIKSACFKSTNGAADNRSVNMVIVNGLYSALLHFSSLDWWLIKSWPASLTNCLQLNQGPGPASCADPSPWGFLASNSAQGTLPGCLIEKQKHTRQPERAVPLHPSWRGVPPLSMTTATTSGRSFTPY